MPPCCQDNPDHVIGTSEPLLTGDDGLAVKHRIAVLPEQNDTQTPYGLYEWAEVARSYPDLARLRSLRQVVHPVALGRRGEEVFFFSSAGDKVADVSRLERLGDAGRDPDDLARIPGMIDALVCVMPAIGEKQPFGLYATDRLVRALADARSEEDVISALKELQQAKPPRDSKRSDPAAEPKPPFGPWNSTAFRLSLRLAAGLLAIAGILVLADHAPFIGEPDNNVVTLIFVAAIVLFWVSFRRVVCWLLQLVGYNTEPPIRNWRVIVTCPVLAPNETAKHDNIFAGELDERLQLRRGVLATGRDTILDKAASEDLVPNKSLERLQQQVERVLAGQTLFVAVLGGVGWLTGGLEFLVREQPRAFSLAVAVLALSFALAASAYVAGTGTSSAGDLNDIEQVRRIYNHRISAMRARVQLASWLYALSLVLAIAVPILAANQRVLRSTPPVLTWSTDKVPPTLSVTANLDSIPSASEIVLVIRGHSPPNLGEPAVLFAQRAGADATGKASFNASVTVPVGRYETVTAVAGVIETQGKLPECEPGDSIPSACSVVGVPIPFTPSAPVFDLTYKDARLTGSIVINGVKANASRVTSVWGVTAKNPKAAGKRAKKLLYRSHDGPDPTAKITVKLLVPIPSGRYEYVLAGVRKPGTPNSCKHAAATPGCYEIATLRPDRSSA
jgi:hypothetical protein